MYVELFSSASGLSLLIVRRAALQTFVASSSSSAESEMVSLSAGLRQEALRLDYASALEQKADINAKVMQPVALVKVRADVQQVCHTSWRPSVKMIAMLIGFASMVLVNGDPIPFEEKSADGEDVMENVKFWLLFAALMMMAGRQAMKDVQYLIGKVRLTAVPAVPSRFRQKSGASSEVTQTELKVKSVGVATETGGGGVCDDSRNLLGPIYIAKAGERYHLSQSCSGLRGADQNGVQVKTCCLICAKTKRDHTNCEPPSGW